MAESEKDTPAFRAASVHMGHIFALKPKVETSFGAGDLQTAKQRLADEVFESAEAAARAVAEKALELTHESGNRAKKRRRN